MKFVPVDELPKKYRARSPQKKLYTMLDNFVQSGVPVARVEWKKSEYACIEICRVTLHKAIQQHRLPLKVVLRIDEVFIINTDIYSHN